MPTYSTAAQYLTTSEAASALGVSTKSIRRLIASGDLPAKRIGARMIRIPSDALDGLGRDLAASRRD